MRGYIPPPGDLRIIRNYKDITLTMMVAKFYNALFFNSKFYNALFFNSIQPEVEIILS